MFPIKSFCKPRGSQTPALSNPHLAAAQLCMLMMFQRKTEKSVDH